MKINQPTAIGLAVGAIVLAVGVVFWTIKANTVGPPPPITAGVMPPDPTAKKVTPTVNTTPGMALPTPGR